MRQYIIIIDPCIYRFRRVAVLLLIVAVIVIVVVIAHAAVASFGSYRRIAVARLEDPPSGVAAITAFRALTSTSFFSIAGTGRRPWKGPTGLPASSYRTNQPTDRTSPDISALNKRDHRRLNGQPDSCNTSQNPDVSDCVSSRSAGARPPARPAG